MTKPMTVVCIQVYFHIYLTSVIVLNSESSIFFWQHIAQKQHANELNVSGHFVFVPSLSFCRNSRAALRTIIQTILKWQLGSICYLSYISS